MKTHLVVLSLFLALISKCNAFSFGGKCVFEKNGKSILRSRNAYTAHKTLTMGMKVKIRIVGRKNVSSNDKWLEEGCSMYSTRLRSSNVLVETEWHKNDEALIKAVENDRRSSQLVVLLDPTYGKIPKSSEKFTEDVYKWLEQGGSRLVFVIGGAEGLPRQLRDAGAHYGNNQNAQASAFTFLSLSPLTFTHQFARLLLIEQIYRASEIHKGSSYHK